MQSAVPTLATRKVVFRELVFITNPKSRELFAYRPSNWMVKATGLANSTVKIKRIIGEKKVSRRHWHSVGNPARKNISDTTCYFKRQVRAVKYQSCVAIFLFWQGQQRVQLPPHFFLLTGQVSNFFAACVDWWGWHKHTHSFGKVKIHPHNPLFPQAGLANFYPRVCRKIRRDAFPDKNGSVHTH